MYLSHGVPSFFFHHLSPRLKEYSKRVARDQRTTFDRKHHRLRKIVTIPQRKRVCVATKDTPEKLWTNITMQEKKKLSYTLTRKTFFKKTQNIFLLFEIKYGLLQSETFYAISLDLRWLKWYLCWRWVWEYMSRTGILASFPDKLIKTTPLCRVLDNLVRLEKVSSSSWKPTKIQHPQ